MRPRLFAILLALTLVLALVAGLSVDWLPADAEPPHVLPLSLAAVSYVAALALGLTVKPAPFSLGEATAGRGEEPSVADPGTGAAAVTSSTGGTAGTDDTAGTGDNRPTLLFIWWPIVAVSLLAAAFGPLLLSIPSSGGSGLPGGIILVVGALGLFAVPIVVRYTMRDFGELGLRGFWGSARRTEWGDGIPPVA